MSYQVQRQAHEQAQAQAQLYRNPEIVSVLMQRAEHKMALKSPYTVLIRPNVNGTFNWIIYSIGRPRNIVWGTADREHKIKVEKGCSWETLKIINKLLETRGLSGYIVVSTIAKDRINIRIFGNLIKDAYTTKSGVYYLKYEISERDVQERINKIRIETDARDILEASFILAQSILLEKNIAQNLNSTFSIPDSLIYKIHDYIEHNTTLSNSSLPDTCPTYEDCERDEELKMCSLYHENFGLL